MSRCDQHVFLSASGGGDGASLANIAVECDIVASEEQVVESQRILCRWLIEEFRKRRVSLGEAGREAPPLEKGSYLCYNSTEQKH